MRDYIDLVKTLYEVWSPELTAKNYGEKLKQKMIADPSLKNCGLRVIYSNGKQEIQEISTIGYLAWNLEQIVDYFAQFDPTKKKYYLLNWIIPKYLSGGIRLLEDLSGVKSDLAYFHEYKHLMSVNDIKSIPDASTLSKIVREVRQSMNETGIFVPKQEADAAKSESILVHENEEFVIVIPLSERAAGYWGRYSEWCTAYGYEYGINPTKTSYFNYYDGPGQRLLIFFDKKAVYNDDGSTENNGSVQCSYKENDIQIGDIDDDNVKGKIAQLIEMIPEDKRELVVKNCLGYLVYKDGSLIQEYNSLSELINEHGDDKLKWAINYVIEGNDLDVMGAGTIEECLDAMPLSSRRMLDKYLDAKYPDETSALSILRKYEDEEEALIDKLKQADLYAREVGASNELYENIQSALSRAGVVYENLDSSAYIRYNIIDYLSGKEIETITMQDRDQPWYSSYGFSGYNDETFKEEFDPFIEELMKNATG